MHYVINQLSRQAFFSESCAVSRSSTYRISKMLALNWNVLKDDVLISFVESFFRNIFVTKRFFV